MINSNLRCKDNTFSEKINTFTKIIQKKMQNIGENAFSGVVKAIFCNL